MGVVIVMALSCSQVPYNLIKLNERKQCEINKLKCMRASNIHINIYSKRRPTYKQKSLFFLDTLHHFPELTLLKCNLFRYVFFSASSSE